MHKIIVIEDRKVDRERESEKWRWKGQGNETNRGKRTRKEKKNEKNFLLFLGGRKTEKLDTKLHAFGALIQTPRFRHIISCLPSIIDKYR